MTNLRPYKNVFLLSVINLSVIACFKCEFKKFKFGGVKNRHFCSIIPDSSDVNQNYLLNKITSIEYNGTEHEAVAFTNLKFSICDTFPNLLRIKINNVKSVDENVFKNCKKAEYIDISGTDMEKISETFYSENSELYHIVLKRNKFTTLPENIFSHLKELRILDLEYNEICSLPLSIFKSNPNLERLFLSHNKIRTLHHEWFDTLTSLKGLTLDHNQITDLPKNIFSSLVNLDTLLLSVNNLTVIHSDSFSFHRNLIDCTFNYNKIEAIDEKFFSVALLENSKNFEWRGNECIDETSNQDRKNYRSKFKKCFKNYLPREM